MSTTQFTAPRTVTCKSGMILPATITPQTDMNLMVTAIAVYHRLNERKTAYDTLEKTMEAMRDGSAVVTLYTDAKGELAARVLWPLSITLTKANDLTAYCYCTLRREFRSFRLDRIITCHPLTTPDDAEQAA
ncbi:MAG: WYL domain-containing protein [Thermomicrobia bacterium]|nr:WYL domain-containing protein [Thermomicrobia bacterium]